MLLLSAGIIDDPAMVAALIDGAGPFARLIAGRGYDTNNSGATLAAEAVIIATPSRRAPIACDRPACRARDIVEGPWCGPESFRRTATHCDKLAASSIGGALIAVSMTRWCNRVRTLAGRCRHPGQAARRGASPGWNLWCEPAGAPGVARAVLAVMVALAIRRGLPATASFTTLAADTGPGGTGSARVGA